MSTGLIVTIAYPGWRRKRTLYAVSGSGSWTVSSKGIGSFSIRARDAHMLGFESLRGLWIRVDFGRSGLWGGVIKRNPTEVREGMMELSCDSFHILLRGIVTQRTYRQASAPAGTLWLSAISDLATDRAWWIDSFEADEGGPCLQMEWRGDDLYDLTDYLATNSGHEWDVVLNDDWSISAVFRKQVGRDKRGSVLLADNYNVRAGSVQPSNDSLINTIYASTEEEDWEGAESTVAINAASRDQYGTMAATRRYAATLGAESLYTRAQADLATLAKPAIPATILIPRNNIVVSDIRQGDTVRYWSVRQNEQYEFRVLSRSIDLDEGDVKLGGDCEALTI